MDYNQCFKISFEQMYYFITIADEKNISKTADKLFISQPLLSKTIMKIESLLNTTLFERTRNGLILTADGKYLYKRWKKLIALYSESLDNISSDKKIQLGILNIHDPLNFIKEYFTKNIGMLNIKTDDLYQLYSKFKHGEYEAIITQEPFLSFICSDYEKKLLVSTPMKIICKKEHPLAKAKTICSKDLCSHTAVLYCSNLNDSLPIDGSNKLYFENIGMKMPNIVYTENFGNALLNVALNNSFCFCDSFYFEEKFLPEDLIMKSISDLSENYYLCYHKELSRTVDALFDNNLL